MNFTKLKPSVSVFTYSLLLSAYFFLVSNYSFLIKFFHASGGLHWNNILFIVAVYSVLFIVLFLTFYLTAFKYLTKFLSIFFIIPSGFVSYSIINYNTYFDSEIIRSIVETDKREAVAYLSPGFLIYAFCTIVLPVIFVLMVKINYPTLKNLLLKKAIALGLCLVCVLILFFAKSNAIISFGRENKNIVRTITPFNYIAATSSYINDKYMRQKIQFTQIGLDAKMGSVMTASKKKTIVIFVVGETARAASFSLNGYERNTNALLQKKPVISFSQFYSCGTVTAVSVPCMFSYFGRSHFSIAQAEQTENLLDVVQRAGYNVTWLDNNSGSKQVAKRVKELSMGDPKYCAKGECLDDVLIQNLPTKDELAKNDRNQFIILHQVGSHGPKYYDRYTDEFKKFVPDCRNPILKDCSRESIINSYDNSIVYTDHNINEAIKYLEKMSDTYNTALVYVSDHGESTGELGLYLHGMPYVIAPDSQIHVPFIVWFSNDFKKMQKINLDCLNLIKNQKFSHDNIFHSFLGLLDVKTSVYNSDLDLFKQCKENRVLR